MLGSLHLWGLWRSGAPQAIQPQPLGFGDTTNYPQGCHFQVGLPCYFDPVCRGWQLSFQASSRHCGQVFVWQLYLLSAQQCFFECLCDRHEVEAGGVAAGVEFLEGFLLPDYQSTKCAALTWWIGSWFPAEVFFSFSRQFLDE